MPSWPLVEVRLPLQFGCPTILLCNRAACRCSISECEVGISRSPYVSESRLGPNSDFASQREATLSDGRVNNAEVTVFE